MGEVDTTTMSFDDLNKNVPDDVAEARGDNFEPTDTLDPFSTVDSMFNAEEDDLSGGGEDTGSGEGVEPEPDKGEPAAAVKPEGEDAKPEGGEEQEWPEGQVKDVPYPVFKKRMDSKNNRITELEKQLAEQQDQYRIQQQQQQPPAKQQQEGGEADAGAQAEPKQQQGQQQENPVQVIEAKIKTASREYSEAVIDGDVDRAAELHEELTTLQADLSVEKAEARAVAREATRAAEQSRIDAQKTVDDVVGRHAEYFNDPFNLDQFRTARDYFIINDGMSLSDAIVAAENRIFGKADKTPPTQLDNGTEAGEEDIQNLRDKTRTQQQQRAVQRGVKTAAGQPPQMAAAASAVGNRSGNSTKAGNNNALTKSSKELHEMPRAEYKRNRGDIVA